MNGVAILLTKDSMNAVMQAILTPKGRANFAWACLNVPMEDYRYFYVSINPADPFVADYGMQIMSGVMLGMCFEYNEPREPTVWFPVTLRKT